jgi:hypothetical protein
MSDAISRLVDDPAVSVIGTAIGGAVVALWLAAAWWAYSDAQRRTDSTLAGLVVAAWIVVSTPLLLPLSLAIYTLARPQQTAAEHRTRDLAAALLGLAELADPDRCPRCRGAVQTDWLRCPACSWWLATPCADCGGWSEASLPACPWCGGEERAAPLVESLEPTLTPRRLRSRRSRRVARAAGPAAARASRPMPRHLGASEGRPLAPIRGQ